jgi:hypothetical protein
LHLLKPPEREALKAALAKVEWTQEARYSWRTSKAWSQAASTTEIKEVRVIGNLLLTSIEGGFMRVYDNPSTVRYNNLCKWFDSNFKFLALTSKPRPTILVFSKHTMICITLE